MGETSEIWRGERGRNGPSANLPVDLRVLLTVAVVLPVVAVLLAALLYRSAYDGRIYLGVSAGNVPLQGYTPAEARAVLLARFQRYAALPLTLRFGQQEWKATPAEMGLRFDVEATVESAYAVGRGGGFLDQLRDQLGAWQGGELARQPIFRLDISQRDTVFERLAKQINRQPVDARITLAKSSYQARITPSEEGRVLNVGQTGRRIEEAAAVQSSGPIDLVVEMAPPKIVENDLAPVKALAEQMMSSQLAAKAQDQSWKIERDDIADMLSLRDQPGSMPPVMVDIASQPLQRLVDRIAKAVDRRALNARFEYVNGALKVIREGVDGRSLDTVAAVAAIKKQLASDKRMVDLPLKVAKPVIGSGDAGKIQITGVIEEDSTEYGYPGAMPERVHNVELATSRLNGIVVAPGATFSFNDEVGAVNTLSGYQTALGITQQGGNAITVESVGGGICQVATTLFHPVFWAGYPIGDRVPHLYWIPRYGIPPKGMTGLDTTVDQIYDKDGNLVYAVDFTFKNTTPNAVLIQAKADGKKVKFSLLGIKPSWQVAAEPPKIDNVRPKLTNDERQENPEWPAGRTVMIEEAREGFRATILRTVTQDGKVIDKRSLVSDYQPTRNVVMVGTKGAAPTPPKTPTPVPTAVPSGTVTTGSAPASPTKAAATPTAVPTGSPAPPATSAPRTTPVATPAPTTARTPSPVATPVPTASAR